MSGLKKLLFGEPPVIEQKVEPREVVRKWQRDLQHQMRGLDREMESMKREETKVTLEMKKLAKQGASRSALGHLAKSLVQHRKQREKLLISRVQLNSVVNELTTIASQMRLAKTMQASTVLMKQINSMMSIPKLRQVTQDFAQEMYKANIVEEQISDAFEMLEDPEEDSLADEEVDKVMDEVVGAMVDNAGSMKYRSKQEQLEQEKVEAEANAEDDMMAQLASM
jgi:charged multivesicular body protein 3